MKRLRQNVITATKRSFSILHSEKGHTLIGYGLLFVLIAVVCMIMAGNIR